MPVFPEGITDAERRSIMFEALSALDLSSLVEKRENLTYLSWANCFSVLKQIYPLATYRVIKNPATGLPFFTDPAVGIFVYTEVEIEGITCLEKCKNTECGKTPFVLVNDEVISDATLAKVLEKINEIAKQ